MIKQILCDLDGTMIHFDHQFFIKNYIKLISKNLAEYIEPELFSKALLAATGHMIMSGNPQQTNAERFWNYLELNTNYKLRKLEPVINNFYETEFQQLKKWIKPANFKPILLKIQQRNIPIAIATNPVFPLIAVHSRIRWGGYDPDIFNLITSYESSHYCKPQIEYYQEILDKLNCDPNECLMIGNDVSDDLAAGKLGIKTYLLTDTIINYHQINSFNTDYQGTCADLFNDIEIILAKTYINY